MNSEIENLKIIKLEWSKTNCDKFSASSLLSKIRNFNHTFTANFKNGKELYGQDSSSEIDISDAIEDLEIYSKSKLKVKDDKYFYRGLEKLESGLEMIIFKLENKSK